MTDWPTREGRFVLGDLAVQKGGVIPAATLHWKAHGVLSAARDNAILYPTSYGATAAELEWLIRPDGVLDPTRWLVVQVDMLGNGVSSSRTSGWISASSRFRAAGSPKTRPPSAARSTAPDASRTPGNSASTSGAARPR